MAYLILVRHGLTDWNKAGRWHGLTNISINEEGKKEAQKDSQILKDIPIDKAYTSNLDRTKQTYEIIQKQLNLKCPVISDAALNERDYGIYTGENKREVKKELGEKEFVKLRRDWSHPIPNGETLKDVYNRVVPYFKKKILADLKKGKNILIVSSGNTLRALMKYLLDISDHDIAKMELNFGEVDVLTIDKNGKVLKREIKASDLYQNHK